ncbi:cation diffusion facilitator family transporter [Clostridium cavendishii DSM 21758]|uniref:Cation diffusion facilitator family transporter n=1 Tax=Clostridium cavendishii DSM 21758 TaxID=1121302 RepID=A0A1M6D3J4_9CLOT|nr:cation diffusion facilitator family transporter [Clostridium cavendishii]SHI67548.1 cation diffusion facilitator family transporter [Clostridium cavendishii DSM 21758]
MNSKIKIARLSIFSNTLLIILKVIVSIITGSMSIFSEAIHSTVDLLASLITFISVKFSDKPADKEHPYGHGKYENISGVIEALLILLPAIWIIVEAFKKLFIPHEISSPGIGFLVMAISSFVNFLVSRKLYIVAKENDSIALEADALHLKADVYTSLGVALGLMLIFFTKITFLDPLIAILVSCFIIKESIELFMNAFSPLLDTKISDAEIEAIEKLINSYNSVYCNFHNLRTRKAGSKKYIDLHLVMPKHLTVEEAYNLACNIETALQNSLANTEVLIHLESCKNDCTTCDHFNNSICQRKTSKSNSTSA